MAYSFRLIAWHAVAPRLHTLADWQQWAEHPESLADLPERAPDLTHIPALQRRRLAPAARLLTAALHPLTAYGPAPLIYISHDGEINRSFALWDELIRADTVSPLSFGLSVHNALPGQYSILHDDTSEQTALCAREACLETAVIEACATLADGAPRVRIAVVENPPDAAHPLAGSAPFPFALALLIAPGDSHRLHRNTTDDLYQSQKADWQGGAPMQPDNSLELASRESKYWTALDWIRAEIRHDAAQTVTCQSVCWQWERL